MANLVKQLNAARGRVAAARAGVVRAGVAAGLALAGSASHAAGFDDILDAISIGSFDTKIIAVGLVVVGIYLTMQGITVAKRVISKI